MPIARSSVFAFLFTSSCLVACTSSSPDAGAADAGAAVPDAAGALDAGPTPDPTTSTGFRVTAATNAALVGAYALRLDAFPNGATTGYNGSFPEDSLTGASGKARIEMEVVTDASNAVTRAHFWSYDASGTNPEKFYGCDGTATLPCTGVTVDTAKKVVGFASVTWKEVTADLTGAGPDQVTAGGGTVTLAGDAIVK
jgi:hypothetical protein